ncbi:hypothetical protein [Rhizobium leguminosarum]|nr:hypothetical protein [Rhizobium leguminosarum]
MAEVLHVKILLLNAHARRNIKPLARQERTCSPPSIALPSISRRTLVRSF